MAETLSRTRFEQLNADLFKRCSGPLTKLLAEAAVEKEEVDEIILVGGSTRIPAVQVLLREFFDGKVPNSGPSPDEAVAHGAALQAEGLAVEINAELAAANAARWADDAVLERVGALAAVMSKVGRGSEALALHERAVTANPKRPSAHVKLGSALGTAGRTAEAAGMFGRAVTLYGAAAAAAGHNPLEASGLGVFDALSKHALALAKLSRMPEALAAYDRALATEGTEELSDKARASVHGQRALALRALQVRAQRQLRFSNSAG